MRMIKGQKGLSLVEVTIMLLVLMLLTSVLAPSIFDFVHDAQWVKVKEDCEAIGISVTRLVRDVGPCLKTTGTSGSIPTCTVGNRVDVIVSDGNLPAYNGLGAGTFTSSAMATTNWNTAPAGNWDTMENQLVTNAPGYTTPLLHVTGYYPVGPQFNLGWRGAYLAPPIGPDPWGTRYMVNTGFLATANNASGTDEGSSSRWWESDVFCISAGPNQTIETGFHSGANFGTIRQADDFVFVIQGSSR